MSIENLNGKGNVQTTQILKKNAHYFEAFLDLDEPWCVWDTDFDNYEYQQRVEKLKSAHAVNFAGWISPGDTDERESYNRVKQYELTAKAKAVLRQALDVQKLPCGHRVHVYNPSGIDGLSCRYCCDDPNSDPPVYSKDTVKALL